MAELVLTPHERRVFYRLVRLVVFADDRLDDAEVEHLQGLYTRLGIGPEEREAVEAMTDEVDVATLAGSLSAPLRKALRNELLDAAWADRAIHRSEAQIIVEAVADALLLEDD